jgi:hypothetical protein
MLRLDWIHREDGQWCHLERVDLDCIDTGGVYLIWHGGDEPKVVRVGQGGDLAQHLQRLKETPEILAYKDRGELYLSDGKLESTHRQALSACISDYGQFALRLTLLPTP